MTTLSRSNITPIPANKGIGNQLSPFEIAERIADLMTEATERLFKLQSQVATEALTDNADCFALLLKARNPDDLGAVQAKLSDLCRANSRRILNVTSSCFEILPQTQVAIAKLLAEPLSSSYPDRYADAISETGEAAAITMKNSLAQTKEKAA